VSRRLTPPPREYPLNVLAAHVPIVSLRTRLYASFGVRFEERRTTSLMLGCWIHAPRGIAIGARSQVGPRCFLDGRGGISIGRDVNISGFSRIVTGTHDPLARDFAGTLAPVTLSDRVWVATGATILPGVTMGEGSMAAAGAVVTGDVDAFTIVGGVPAKPIGERPADLSYELGGRQSWR
jgi:maltose O-acetyltransferase